MNDTAAVREAIHFCSVPAYQLPALAAHGVQVDTGRVEFGRRIAGKLLGAARRGDEITGSVQMQVRVRARSVPSFVGGGYEMQTVTSGFALRVGERAIAHLPSSLLAATEGAYDLEDTWAHERATDDNDRVIALISRIRQDANPTDPAPGGPDKVADYSRPDHPAEETR